MNFNEQLKKGVNSEEEILENTDLVEISKVNEYDVPETLTGVKNRITGLLNFRNNNKDLNPNCYELTDLLVDLNNSLNKEIKKENPDFTSCENIKKSLDILYNNVINHALIDTSKMADKNSNLFKLYEALKSRLNEPSRINIETKEYLKVISGVNFYQREKLTEGEIVYPNDYEKGIINDSPEYDISEDLKSICFALEQDIQKPEIMREELTIA